MMNLKSAPKWVAGLVGLAFLTSSTIPAASRSVAPAPDETSPVRCKMTDGVNGRYSGPPVRPMTRQGGMAGQSLPFPAAPQQAVGDIAKRSAIAPYPLPYPGPAPKDRERYDGKEVASVKSVANEPVSTFSIDVDTGSYANVRRFLMQGQLPPPATVRTEEMLNYFRYDYPTPKTRERPIGMTTDMAITPWNPETRLLRVGIKGFDLPRDKRPPSNLVFLIDVSGSMFSADKLPLVKRSLAMLADRIGPQDKVSIVVYASAVGIVLEPTNKPRYIRAALDCLEAGGSTAGGQGMELAYATAKANFIKGGVNRVIMATDGDFNVGIRSTSGIEEIVKKHRDAGIMLTTLGFGQGNYNEAMMEKIADIGNGNYAYIDTVFEAQKVLDEEMAATLFTIAKDVKIQIEFNPAVVREYRLIGYENRLLAEEDFNNDKVDAGDMGAGHQVTALYEIVPSGAKGWLPDRRYEGNRITPRPDHSARELAWLKLRYKLPDGERSMLVEQPVRTADMHNARLPTGDLAFAAAVAAYGQKLRGDKYLRTFVYADIRALAGRPSGYLREEFVKLASVADDLEEPSSSKAGGLD
jgi:Ca-activated chloride channel homolog